MKSQLADFVSLLYPRVCLACNVGLTKKEEHLCLGCELSLPKSQYLTNKEQLLKKFAFQPKVIAAYAYLDFIKDGIVQKMIYGIKYKGKRELGIWLGDKFGGDLRSEIEQALDVILPLPLHPNRMKRRGYNQSEQIAMGLSNVLKIPIETGSVIRNVETLTQTKKSKLMRWQNMESVFLVINPLLIENKHVLIVDDVITTGATMGVLCDEIADFGPASITIAALAAGK